MEEKTLEDTITISLVSDFSWSGLLDDLSNVLDQKLEYSRRGSTVDELKEELNLLDKFDEDRYEINGKSVVHFQNESGYLIKLDLVTNLITFQFLTENSAEYTKTLFEAKEADDLKELKAYLSELNQELRRIDEVLSIFSSEHGFIYSSLYPTSDENQLFLPGLEPPVDKVKATESGKLDYLYNLSGLGSEEASSVINDLLSSGPGIEKFINYLDTLTGYLKRVDDLKECLNNHSYPEDFSLEFELVKQEEAEGDGIKKTLGQFRLKSNVYVPDSFLDNPFDVEDILTDNYSITTLTVVAPPNKDFFYSISLDYPGGSLSLTLEPVQVSITAPNSTTELNQLKEQLNKLKQLNLTMDQLVADFAKEHKLTYLSPFNYVTR